MRSLVSFRVWLAAGLLSVFQTADAAEEWLCTEASSTRTENVLTVCGIGESKNEAEARSLALQQAKKEFLALCAAPADCRDRDANVTPLRTTCEKEGDRFRCYRGVRYVLGEKRLARAPQSAATTLEAQAPEERLPRSRTGLFVGIDFCGLGSSYFAGEGFTLSVGGNVRYKPTSLVGVELGGNFDIIFPNTYRAATGHNIYGALPLYFLHLSHADKDSALFIAPEVRYVEHGTGNVGTPVRLYRTAYGISLGWHDLISDFNYGWGARIGVYDIVGSASHPAVRINFTYLFGW